MYRCQPLGVWILRCTFALALAMVMPRSRTVYRFSFAPGRTGAEEAEAKGLFSVRYAFALSILCNNLAFAKRSPCVGNAGLSLRQTFALWCYGNA